VIETDHGRDVDLDADGLNTSADMRVMRRAIDRPKECFGPMPACAAAANASRSPRRLPEVSARSPHSSGALTS